MEGIIYMYKSPSNKYYIGQTANEEKRIYQHAHNVGNKHGKFQNAIKKYGFNAFEYKVLFRISGEDERFMCVVLNRMERLYINKYNSLNSGYNMTNGGRGVKGLKHTEETKLKCSIANTGRFVGEKHPMYGKTHTDEAKAKIKEKRKFQWVDENGNTTSWNKGLKTPENIKDKLSAAKKGKLPPNIIKVDMYNRDMVHIKTFESMSSAAIFLGFRGSYIKGIKKSCATGKMYKNYFFKINGSSQTIEKQENLN